MKGITVLMNDVLRERVSASPMYDSKVVKSVDMSEDALNIRFEDDTGITITDEGQSCCEHRYMTTDDDVQSLVGSVIQTIMVKSGPDIEVDYDSHEQEFLEIQTNKGFITIIYGISLYPQSSNVDAFQLFRCGCSTNGYVERVK